MTEPGHRARGMATACARALCGQVSAAGRVASWSTSVDNAASRRLAEKLGFEHARSDVLYAIR